MINNIKETRKIKFKDNHISKRVINYYVKNNSRETKINRVKMEVE